MDNLMSLNVYNFIYFVIFVKLWGLFWGWFCFVFEFFNGEIIKVIYGIGNVCREVFWFFYV